MNYSFEQKLKRSGTVESGASLEGADSWGFRSEESLVASLETGSSYGPTCHCTALFPACSGISCFSISFTMWTKLLRKSNNYTLL